MSTPQQLEQAEQEAYRELMTAWERKRSAAMTQMPSTAHELHRRAHADMVCQNDIELNALHQKWVDAVRQLDFADAAEADATIDQIEAANAALFAWAAEQPDSAEPLQ